MRNEVCFYLNGQRRSVSGRAAFDSLVEFIRGDCRLVGTKIGCGEGDCGACTILIGRPENGRIRYRAATSCILTPCQVDGAHLVTIEGLQHAGQLSPLQEAMVACHGSQCGYCTPGIIVALSGLLETEPDPDDEALRTALTGNLCRCTGYLPILEAGRGFDRVHHRRLAELYPETEILADLTKLAADSLEIEAESARGRRIFFRPDRLDHALAIKASQPDAVVVSGGTDLGVWKNRRDFDPLKLLCLAAIGEWNRIDREGNEVSIAANVTWAQLEEFAAKNAPELLDVSRHFASPQIRNVATFVGNVAHGSPIADSVSFLHVVDARLELVGPRGRRMVAVGDFFTGYRETILADDELIARIVVPVPEPGERVGLYKISKRKEMDISTFRAAIRLRLKDGLIDHAALAFAGVSAKVIRLPETEAYLIGKPDSEATFREAGRRARSEIAPVSDLRGSRDFRLILAENILLKFLREGAADG